MLTALLTSFFVEASPVKSFENVQCVFSVNDQPASCINQKLIPLAIGSEEGRFAQIVFLNTAEQAPSQIQYQVLIEKGASENEVNVLQNLKVGDLESSSEFAAIEPRYVRLSQGVNSVRCEFLKAHSVKCLK